MDELDERFTEAIVNTLTKKLERSLTSDERNAFKIQRSGMAYEMMMDYISDENLTKAKLEIYVQQVVAEVRG